LIMTSFITVFAAKPSRSALAPAFAHVNDDATFCQIPCRLCRGSVIIAR
jgi:hypothetical protein